MKRVATTLVLCAMTLGAAGQRAKNVILFIGDAGGIPTLNAASIQGYGEPQKLFVQQMPHIGLSDTSAADALVTDSAAGMTAIVTGRKTKNGVLSQSADAVRGSKDGTPLKTILEYAEERGLSTGVISNMSMADATPAACYSHVNDRKKAGEIFSQVVKPRFGDGVDLIIGPGRKAIYDATAKLSIDLGASLKERGYAVVDSPEAIPAGARRAVCLMDSAPSDLGPAVQKAIEILSRNPKGFFLMVEGDMHTDNVELGLNRAVMLDNIIRRAAEAMAKDTLVLFAADHSFDLRVRGGRKEKPLVKPQADGEAATPEKSPVRVDGGHTGEEVLVAAQGPGAGRVKGFFPNTEIFRIMLAAYGWKETK